MRRGPAPLRLRLTTPHRMHIGTLSTACRPPDGWAGCGERSAVCRGQTRPASAPSGPTMRTAREAGGDAAPSPAGGPERRGADAASRPARRFDRRWRIGAARRNAIQPRRLAWESLRGRAGLSFRSTLRRTAIQPPRLVQAGLGGRSVPPNPMPWHRTGVAIGGGLGHPGDRTQAGADPEGSERLHKCALVLSRPTGSRCP